MSAAQPGLVDRLESVLWNDGGTQHPGWQRGALRVLRTAIVVLRDLAFGQLTLRAMSLVYTTLLSIVPLLALSFSVLKAFGVHNQIQPLLLRLLAPLGEDGAGMARHIGEFIDNMNVGVLGALGLALLLYTAVSLVQKIEESLNFIWHSPEPRSLGERFTRYISMLLVGPILVFSALGLTASVMNSDAVRQVLQVDALGLLVRGVGQLLPYLLVIVAFTFVYLFIPNARVRLAPALLGGVVGGIAWQSAGWAFAAFIASSGRYEAIYSGFAILVLFMIWLYVSWVVLLTGAAVAFYAQHPEYLYLGGGEPRLSNRVRERLGLSLMSLVAGRFLDGERGASLPELSHRLGLPGHVLHTVLEGLAERGLLVRSADDPPLYLLARDPSMVPVAQVLDAVRSVGETRFVTPAATPTPPKVEQVLRQVQAAMDGAVEGITVRELAARDPRPAPPETPSAVARSDPPV